MGRFQDVQAFVAESKWLSKMDELRDLLADACWAFGSKPFAVIHHVPAIALDGGVVRLSNQSDLGIDVIRERQCFSNDPIHAAWARP